MSDNICRFTVQVEDTGIGIPIEKQQFIFEKFSRVSHANTGVYSGLGLGLRVVKEYISDLGGEIELDSQSGRGTEFRLLIPFKLPLDSLLLAADAAQ